MSSVRYRVLAVAGILGSVAAVSTGTATSALCRLAVTFDGGLTWTTSALPYSPLGLTTDPVYSNCSDETVLFDPAGTAYVAVSAFGVAFPAATNIQVLTSPDGGRTWSKPVTALRTVVGAAALPLPSGSIGFFIDRPWLALDPNTGALYVSAVQYWADSHGAFHNVVILTSSQDHGQTWTAPKLIDGPVPVGTTETQYPAPAAGRGAVAIAYVVPAGATASAACACVVLSVSTDGGRTFVQRRAPFTSDPSTGNGISTLAAADPTRVGAFALMTVHDGKIFIRRSTDYGRTWGPAATLAASVGVAWEPWLAYSPTGVIGVVWRSKDTDGSFDVWAAYSTSNRPTFSRPVKLTPHTSAAQPFYLSVGGDDTTSIWLTPTRLVASWASTEGAPGMQTWWGGFDLPVIRGASPARSSTRRPQVGGGLAATGMGAAIPALALAFASLAMVLRRRTAIQRTSKRSR